MEEMVVRRRYKVVRKRLKEEEGRERGRELGGDNIKMDRRGRKARG
jgi:hypothetical protein